MVSTRSAAHEASEEPDSLKPPPRSRTASKSPRKVSPTQSAGSPERPIRRKLKNTNIGAESEKTTNTSSDSGSLETTPDKTSTNGDKAKGRGRPKKKRSFDELEDYKTDAKGTGATSKQPRKRSRSDEGSENATAETLAATGEPPHDLSEAEASTTTKTSDDKQESNVQKQDPDKQALPDGSEDAVSKAATPPRLEAPSDEVEPAITGPKNKRNRDSFIQDQAASPAPVVDKAAASNGSASTFEKESTPSTKEPEKKKLRDEKDSEAEISTKDPPASGFSNTSSASPFGSLAPSTEVPKAPDTEQRQTSSKAFASSGFASFASSSQSPFGGFGTTSTAKKEDEKPAAESKSDVTPSFSSLSGSKSPFASTGTGGFGSTSGFGGASGFGSAGGFGAAGGSSGFGGLGGKAPLTSWATNGASGIVGTSSKPAKPFGAPAEEEEDEEDGETSEPEDNAIGAADEGTIDPRFKEQQVETGEEGEDTLFQSRAKLYVIDEKQWKEKAVGTFKINVLRGDESTSQDGIEPKKTARLIMRADGSQRIMLNSPITSDINLRDPAGGPPKGKNALFMGFDKGSLRLMQLKMRNAQVTGELHQVISTLLEAVESEP